MMTEHSSNKIELCRWCHGTLTPNQYHFDSQNCIDRWTEQWHACEGLTPLFVYTNFYMLGLLRGNQIAIVDFSSLIFTDQELVLVARLQRGALDTIGDSEALTYGAWSRKIEDYPKYQVQDPDMEKIRAQGFLAHLSEKGITTERDVAHAIGSICDQIHITPIKLFDCL